MTGFKQFWNSNSDAYSSLAGVLVLVRVGLIFIARIVGLSQPIG